MKFNVKNNLEGWHFNFARGKVKSLKTTVLNGNLLHKNTGKKRNSKTKAENYPFLIFLSCSSSPVQAFQPMESKTKAAVTVEIKKVFINKENNCKLWSGILKAYLWEIKCFSAHQECHLHILLHTDYFVSSSTSILLLEVHSFYQDKYCHRNTAAGTALLGH